MCEWTAVAVNRDSDNPELWTQLAVADIDLKAYGLARIEYYRALSCDKWFTEALQGLGQLAGLNGDWKQAVHFYRLALTTAVDDAGVDGAIARVDEQCTTPRQNRLAADVRGRHLRSVRHGECQFGLKFSWLPSILILVAVFIDPRRKAS